jgi:dihydroorotase/N-acyl-D-amino-acid deacylase
MLAAVCAAMLAGVSAHAAERYDILIRGGTVLDGTGKPGVRADVGVRGDRIVFVGDAGQAEATRVIDAKGLTVAPGFIDAHNHVPDYFLEMRQRKGDAAPDRSPILNEGCLVQGVTTLVGGPDGFLSPKSMRAMFAHRAFPEISG